MFAMYPFKIFVTDKQLIEVANSQSTQLYTDGCTASWFVEKTESVLIFMMHYDPEIKCEIWAISFKTDYSRKLFKLKYSEFI